MKKYTEQQVTIVNEIVIQKRDHLSSLSEWILAGNQLTVGQEVTMERGYRAKLQTGFILNWIMSEVAYDLTGLGKFGECIATVYDYETGNVLAWPFTMLYINEHESKSTTTKQG